MFIVCKLFVTMSGPCLNHSESQNGLNREIIFDLPLFPDQHGSFKTESIEFKAREKGMCIFWTLSAGSQKSDMCMAMELKSVLLCVHVETNYTLKTHLMAHYLVNLSSLKGYNGQSSVFFINSAEIWRKKSANRAKKWLRW